MKYQKSCLCFLIFYTNCIGLVIIVYNFFFIFKTQMVNGVKKVFEFLVYFLKYIKRQ